MAFDLILRAARIAGREGRLAYVGVLDGCTAVIEPDLPADGPEQTIEGCFGSQLRCSHLEVML
jgi:hypothetical protein